MNNHHNKAKELCCKGLWGLVVSQTKTCFEYYILVSNTVILHMILCGTCMAQAAVIETVTISQVPLYMRV